MAEKQARAAILAANAAAAEHIRAVRGAAPLTYELLHREISEYIKCKFRLTDEDCVTDSFSELAEISLANSVKLPRALVSEADLAKGCDGASSKTAKMALLILALQRDLDIRFRPEEIGAAQTLSEISALIWAQMKPGTKEAEST